MYSTNSTTTTSGDLGEVRRVERIYKPRTVNQPFSRLTDGQRHPVTTRKVPAVGIEADGARKA